ncbi:MAG TPA: Hsp20/alpha crystallin family protein [Terriglobia bacterium]|nr:Hsp20/alpha crystallin family protein [Terriglobia bacterium]
MNNLSVRYLFPDDPDALSLFETLNEMQEAIRQRAFGLFEERGTAHGGEMEDWLHAERELVWVPASETTEDDKQFRLRLIVPGLEAKDLQITAMPDAIIVQAEALSKESKKTSTIPFRELRDRKLFRRFDFGEPIDPARTVASLTKGILEIVASKAAPAKQVKVAIQGA